MVKNQLKAVLKKNTQTKNGFPFWTTPDNKTLQIYMENVKIPNYDITLHKWKFVMLHNKMKIVLEAPAPEPVTPPHLVTWMSDGKPDNSFSIKETDKNAYSIYSTETPEYVKISDKESTPYNKTYILLKKSNKMNEGFPVWTDADDKLKIVLEKEEMSGLNKWKFKDQNNMTHFESSSFSDPVTSPHLVLWSRIYIEQFVPDSKKDVKSEELTMGPTYLHLRNVMTNDIWMVLKKQPTLKNGASQWMSPDNKFAQIYFDVMNGTKGSVMSWIMKISLYNVTEGGIAAITPTKYPHQSVWQTFDKETKDWIQDDRNKVEESNQEEYNKIESEFLKYTTNTEQIPNPQPGGFVPSIMKKMLMGKKLIFGPTSLSPHMAIGSVLTDMGVIGGVGQLGSNTLNEVGGMGEGVFDGVGETAGGLFTVVGAGTSGALSGVGLGSFGKGADIAIDGLGEGVKGFLSNMGAGVGTFSEGLSDGTQHYTGSLESFFKGDISGTFGGISKGTGDIIGNTGGAIFATADGVLDAGNDVVKGAFDGVSETAGGIFKKASDFTGVSVIDDAGKGIQTFLGGTRDVFSGTTDLAGDVFKSVGGGVQDIGSSIGDWLGK